MKKIVLVMVLLSIVLGVSANSICVQKEESKKEKDEQTIPPRIVRPR